MRQRGDEITVEIPKPFWDAIVTQLKQANVPESRFASFNFNVTFELPSDVLSASAGGQINGKKVSWSGFTTVLNGIRAVSKNPYSTAYPSTSPHRTPSRTPSRAPSSVSADSSKEEDGGVRWLPCVGMGRHRRRRWSSARGGHRPHSAQEEKRERRSPGLPRRVPRRPPTGGVAFRTILRPPAGAARRPLRPTRLPARPRPRGPESVRLPLRPDRTGGYFGLRARAAARPMGTGPALTGIGRVAHSRMHGSTGRASQRRNLHPRAGVENSAQPVVGQGDGPAGRMRFASVPQSRRLRRTIVCSRSAPTPMREIGHRESSSRAST